MEASPKLVSGQDWPNLAQTAPQCAPPSPHPQRLVLPQSHSLPAGKLSGLPCLPSLSLSGSDFACASWAGLSGALPTAGMEELSHGDRSSALGEEILSAVATSSVYSPAQHSPSSPGRRVTPRQQLFLFYFVLAIKTLKEIKGTNFYRPVLQTEPCRPASPVHSGQAETPLQRNASPGENR